MNPTEDSTARVQAPSASAPNSMPPWVLPVAIGLLTLIVFFPPLVSKNFLGIDDQTLIGAQNRNLGLGWKNITWAFKTMTSGHYEPLVWISFGFDKILSRGEPQGIYASSLILHLFSAMLLYGIVCRLLVAARAGLPLAPGPQDRAVPWAAAVATLLFALHPLRVESVVWASERRDVLCVFFFLASVLAFLRFREAGSARLEGEQAPPARLGSARMWLIASLLLGVGAVLSKATAAALPLVLLIIDAYPLRTSKRQDKGMWIDWVPFFILSGLCVMKAVQAIKNVTVPEGPESYVVRLAVASQGAWTLLHKMVMPAGLNPQYTMPADPSLKETGLLISLLAAFVLTVVLLLLRKRWPAGLSVWLAYLCLLLPVSGLVAIGVPVEADRNSYLACIPWCILIAGVLWRLMQPRDPAGGLSAPGLGGAGVMAVAVVVLAGMTFQLSRAWRNDQTLWTHILEVDPENLFAQAYLARVYDNEGDFEAVEKMYLSTLESGPPDWRVHTSLGILYGKQARLEDSVEHFRQAKKLAPQSPEPRVNLATNLHFLGRDDEAFLEYRELEALLPEETDDDSAELVRLRARVCNDLGMLHSLRGEYDQAIDLLRKALAAEPKFPQAHCTLSDCWKAKGETTQALAHLQEALRLDPNNEIYRRKAAELLEAQAQGTTPATTPDREAFDKQIAEAIQRLQTVLSEDPTNLSAHNDLGNLLVQTGKLEEGLSHYRQALAQPDPPATVHYNYVRALMNYGRQAEAADAARIAIEKHPDQTQLLGALVWMLATSQDEQVRDPEEALRLGERAAREAPEDVAVLEVLAVAQAANAQHEQAVATLDKALGLMQEAGSESVLDRLRRQREIYAAEVGRE